MPTRWTNVNLFVFVRQYWNFFSRRINAMVAENQPIKEAIFMVMHDFHGLKLMTLNCVADIAYL